jgi:diguanylate cyclase (GGDEF)-like protein
MAAKAGGGEPSGSIMGANMAEATEPAAIPTQIAERILVVEDSPTVAQLVAAKLEGAGYQTQVVADGQAALNAALANPPDLILCDVVMPGLDGFELTRMLRKDPRTTSVSIIMLTGLGNVMEGLESGADDYIVKPFNDVELMARIKSTLRRNKEMRAVSPLTGLPGNTRIEEEIERRISLGLDFAVLYADIDNFKPFNDHYGFARGDGVLRLTGQLIQNVALDYGGAASFVGHLGGDDFIVIASPENAAEIAEQLIARFDDEAPRLYDQADAARSYIETEDRMGEVQRFPPVSISIGVATTSTRKFTHYAEAVAVASEMKSFTKKSVGSTWAVDRRGDTR